MSRANDSTTVSRANDSTTVSEDAKHDHEAHIKVLKGQPTDEELAAVLAVLAGAAGAPAEPREAEQNLWGHPVTRLRYTTFSWQRVTLLERTHMRR